MFFLWCFPEPHTCDEAAAKLAGLALSWWSLNVFGWSLVRLSARFGGFATFLGSLFLVAPSHPVPLLFSR